MEGPVTKSKSTHLHEKANAYQGRTETKAHQRTIHITAASVSDNEDLSKNTTKCLIQINQSVCVCVCVRSLPSVLCRCELSSILTTSNVKACRCVYTSSVQQRWQVWVVQHDQQKQCVHVKVCVCVCVCCLAGRMDVSGTQSHCLINKTSHTHTVDRWVSPWQHTQHHQEIARKRERMRRRGKRGKRINGAIEGNMKTVELAGQTAEIIVYLVCSWRKNQTRPLATVLWGHKSTYTKANMHTFTNTTAGWYIEYL